MKAGRSNLHGIGPGPKGKLVRTKAESPNSGNDILCDMEKRWKGWDNPSRFGDSSLSNEWSSHKKTHKTIISSAHVTLS